VRIPRLPLIVPLAALLTGAASAAELSVPAEPGALARAVGQAGSGDRLLLAPGRHEGGIVIDRPLEIVGAPGAVLGGPGNGSVIVLDAPDIVVRGLTIQGSGSSLAEEDSGIFVTKAARGARVEGNRLQNNLIGVFLKGPSDAVVRGNLIEGRRDLRVNERGNGVQVWNSPGSIIEDNEIRFGRDGIFTNTSRSNVFAHNLFEDVRFAIHYMYTNDSRLEGNVSIGNHSAWAIMFSNGIEVIGNQATGHRDHGLLLNATNNSRIVGNTVIGEPRSEKCAFIYNANKNEIVGNRFEGCQIGVHLTAGSERNVVHDNAFVSNRTQVQYVGTRHVDWSAGGRGNFWSDHWAFDLNRDGIADQPYRPNDLVDQVLWAVPLAKTLINSPVVQLVRWSQSQFPALHPGGLVDIAPLMTAPEGAAADPDLLAARP
jgi:nitrous oxidase accessory protein